MSYTVAQAIAETKHLLMAGHPEPLNKLNGSIGTTTSPMTLTLTYDLGSLRAGTLLGVELEMMYVWSVDDASKTAVVERGREGSTAVTHADALPVHVGPLFSNWRIFQALNDTLQALSSPSNGLYQTTEVTFTFISGKYGYDITGATSVQNVLDVRYDPPGPARTWPKILNFALDRQANTTDFPSGFSLVLKEPAFPGRDVRVVYASPFASVTALTDDVNVVSGLQTTANDLLCLGAALRLQGVREGQRNFNEAQGDTRRAQEVPAGAQNTATRGLQQMYQQRLREESAQARNNYPYKRRVA